MIGAAFQCSVFPLQCFHRPCVQTGGRINWTLPSDPCSSALICTPVSLLWTCKICHNTQGIFNKNIKPVMNESDYLGVEAPEGAVEEVL